MPRRSHATMQPNERDLQQREQADPPNRDATSQPFLQDYLPPALYDAYVRRLAKLIASGPPRRLPQA